MRVMKLQCETQKINKMVCWAQGLHALELVCDVCKSVVSTLRALELPWPSNIATSTCVLKCGALAHLVCRRCQCYRAIVPAWIVHVFQLAIFGCFGRHFSMARYVVGQIAEARYVEDSLLLVVYVGILRQSRLAVFTIPSCAVCVLLLCK
jgi:hypothetical protein